jgi:hypothetical protein
MVTAMILLAIALIICLAFMGITVWMYLNLERDFYKQMYESLLEKIIK